MNSIYLCFNIIFIIVYFILLYGFIKKQLKDNAFFNYKFQYIFTIVLFELMSVLLLNLSNIFFTTTALKTRDMYCFFDFFSFIISTLLMIRIIKIKNKTIENLLFLLVQSLSIIIIIFYAYNFMLNNYYPLQAQYIFKYFGKYNEGVFVVMNYIKFYIITTLSLIYFFYTKDDSKENTRVLFLYFLAYGGNLMESYIRDIFPFYLIFYGSKIVYAYCLVYKYGAKKKTRGRNI